MAESSSRTRASAASSAATEDPKTDTPTPTQAVAAVEPPEETPTFPQERLIAEAEAFGLGAPSWLVTGALSTVKKKQMTVAEAKAAIKAFLATEVS